MTEEKKTDEQRTALWNAVNKYTIACGGQPDGRVYGNVERMSAVVEVEMAARAMGSTARPADLDSLVSLAYERGVADEIARGRAERAIVEAAERWHMHVLPSERAGIPDLSAAIEAKLRSANPPAPSDMPAMQCPQCHAVLPDFDGFGVLAHTKPAYPDGCGYCSHPSRDDGVCGICGDKSVETKACPACGGAGGFVATSRGKGGQMSTECTTCGGTGDRRGGEVGVMKPGEKVGKGFCTKYALSTGIFETGPGHVSEHNPMWVRVTGISVGLRIGSEWFQTRDAAEDNARTRARRKLDALKRQQGQLEGLKQTPKWRTKDGSHA